MELVDVEYKKLYGEMTLIVYIDKEGGVSLDDCETAHRAVDEPLDRLDPTQGSAYHLNVSSPGLDRPFQKERDYLRNIGREVEVSLYKPIDNIKKFEAVLTAYDGNAVELLRADKTVRINLKDVALMRAAIKF